MTVRPLRQEWFQQMLRFFAVASVFLVSFSSQALADQPVRSKIVGGQIVQLGDYPYAVALQAQRYGKWLSFCSGTVIHQRYVLTAGHCLKSFHYDRPDGVNYFSPQTPLRAAFFNLPQTRYVSISRSAFYSSVEHLDLRLSHAPDLGIVQLSEDSPTQPAEIQSSPYASGQLVMMGYGPKGVGDSAHDLLSVAEVSSLSAAECTPDIKGAFDSRFEICGGPTPGFRVGACPGDSGGGVINSTGKLVAVNSWGTDNCGGVDIDLRRTIFSRIWNGLDWLRIQTGVALAGMPAVAQNLSAPVLRSIVLSRQKTGFSFRVNPRDVSGKAKAIGEVILKPLNRRKINTWSISDKHSLPLEANRGSVSIPLRWLKDRQVAFLQIDFHFYLRGKNHNTSLVYQKKFVLNKVVK